MIRAENLSFGFPQKEILEKVSFTLDEGIHCALIGSNGTGKTTLADLILLAPVFGDHDHKPYNPTFTALY